MVLWEGVCQVALLLQRRQLNETAVMSEISGSRGEYGKCRESGVTLDGIGEGKGEGMNEW